MAVVVVADIFHYKFMLFVSFSARIGFSGWWVITTQATTRHYRVPSLMIMIPWGMRHNNRNCFFYVSNSNLRSSPFLGNSLFLFVQKKYFTETLYQSLQVSRVRNSQLKLLENHTAPKQTPMFTPLHLVSFFPQHPSLSSLNTVSPLTLAASYRNDSHTTLLCNS